MAGSFGRGGEKNSNTKEEVMGKDNWSVQEGRNQGRPLPCVAVIPLLMLLQSGLYVLPNTSCTVSFLFSLLSMSLLSCLLFFSPQSLASFSSSKLRHCYQNMIEKHLLIRLRPNSESNHNNLVSQISLYSIE